MGKSRNNAIFFRGGKRRDEVLMLPAGFVPEAVHQVVIDHSCCLQVGVDDGGAQEPESSLFQVPGDTVRKSGGGRDLRKVAETVDHLLVPGEIPQIMAKGAEFVPDIQEASGIVNGRFDLHPVADDPAVLQHGPNTAIVEPGHFFGIEVLVKQAVSLPSFEDGQPAESGLGRFQHQEFELFTIIMNRHSPLQVVVGDIYRIGQAPSATYRFDVFHGDIHLSIQS